MAGFRRTVVYTIPPAEPYSVNTILSGARDPGQADGRDGDFWLNTATVTLFGPKDGDAWPAIGTSLRGTAGVMPATEVTATMHQTEADHTYICNNPSSRVTLVLPAVAPVGSTIDVIGKGAGGWSLDQHDGQTIRLGDLETTPGEGGHIRSTAPFECITVRCVTYSEQWIAVASIGNLSII